MREVFLIFVMIQLNKERLTYHFKASDLLRMELTRQFILNVSLSRGQGRNVARTK